MSDNRENKHNEEPHDSEEEKYSFLQETVKDEQRSKKGIMGNLCRHCQQEKVWLRSMPCTGMKAGRMQGSRLYRELFSGIMEQIF